MTVEPGPSEPCYATDEEGGESTGEEETGAGKGGSETEKPEHG